jgi:tRNA(Ile)-lysidine synthase
MKPDLIDRFIGFSDSHKLFGPEDKIVIALSGGGDSVTLVDLFSRLNQPVVLAHCNFGLRGIESDEEEDFVRKVSVVYDIPVFVTRFETREYALQNGISVEMAARELRYEWFEKIRQEKHCKWIAVAHHADDSIETMLINLTRGTGMRGLSGIQPIQGKVIRPLLFTNRSEITGYLEFRHLEYRTDTSNRDVRYIRNRIRQVILPEFEKINPSVRQTLQEEQLLFAQGQAILDRFIAAKAEELTVREGDLFKINISQLKGEEFAETILFELLRPFGFHGRQIRQILLAAGSISGKVFKSKTRSLLVDRDYILVNEGFELISERYYFDPDFPSDDLPIDLNCKVIPDNNYQPTDNPFMACLDNEKLDRPLILRRWEQGDYFYPLGMDHSKKVSDFLIDRKVNRIDKSRVWVLASGEKIVWILGHRIDHRFRVTEDTREILEITVTPDAG